MRKLLIDKELRDLLPPLTKEEFSQLEENILKDGCQSPIITWNDYIVDGHNRYNICNKHKIEFEELKLAYETKDDIIQWMIDTQLGRRNLTPIQRIAIAEKYRPIIEKKAKENKIKSAEMTNEKLGNTVCQNSDKPIIQKVDTKKELSKIANVSYDTYYKGKRILDSDNEEIKDKLKNKEISINKAYNQLFKKENKKIETDNVEKENFIEESNENNSKNTLSNETEVVIKTNDLLKDANGNIIPITEEGRISTSDFKKMVADIKTPKNIEDYIDNDIVFEGVEQLFDDLIWSLNAKLFTIEKAVLKMEDESKIKLKKIINEYLDKINEIKNKIN